MVGREGRTDERRDGGTEVGTDRREGRTEERRDGDGGMEVGTDRREGRTEERRDGGRDRQMGGGRNGGTEGGTEEDALEGEGRNERKARATHSAVGGCAKKNCRSGGLRWRECWLDLDRAQLGGKARP